MHTHVHRTVCETYRRLYLCAQVSCGEQWDLHLLILLVFHDRGKLVGVVFHIHASHSSVV